MIYLSTDGSITKNPGGRGGWAFLVEWPDGEEPHLASGAVECTTNNRMELQAVLEGLQFLLRLGLGGTPVTIRTDSQWAMRGCRRQQQRVANVDLFQHFDTLASQFAEIGWEWVKGHAGDSANERVDAAARAAAFGTQSVERSSI